MKERYEVRRKHDEEDYYGHEDGDDDKKWQTHARSIVYRGNMAKFSQNDKLRVKLLATGNSILAVIGVDIIRLRTEYTYVAVSIFLLSSSVYVRIVSAIFILAILVVKREILCSQLVS